MTEAVMTEHVNKTFRTIYYFSKLHNEQKCFRHFCQYMILKCQKKNYFSHIKVVTWLEETKKKTNQVLIQHETMSC